MTIAEFLLARIAEDENWARYMRAPETIGPVAQHMLAECGAKRQIVALFTDERDVGALLMQKRVFRALAQSYADHPDFCAEWRPEIDLQTRP